MPYQSNTDVTTLLTPNITTTKKVLTQTGTGTNGAVPVWETAITPKVTLQTSSTTKPTSPNAADVLIVTSDGTATGLVKEVWNYTGTSWVKTQGTDDVSGAILDNTITDPATITTAGRYIVPASGVSGVFVGNEKKFADFDGTSWTLFTTPADATTVIITTGTNTGQTWKYTAATSTWTQVVSGAISIYPWVLSGAYTAGTIVNYQGNLYQANGAIPANTAFTVGTTGATWSAYLKIDDKYTLPANPLQVASGQSIQEAIGNLQGFINRVPTVSPDPSVAGWWKLASWTPLNAGGHDKYAAFMITMIIKGSYGTTVETLYVTINNANPYGYTMMLFPGSRSGGGDIAFTSFAISSDALYGYYNAAAGRSISANVLLLSSFGMTDPPKVTLVNTGSTAVPSGVGGYLSANGNSSTLKNMTGGRLYTSANNSGFAGGAIAYENGGGVSNINDTNASLNDATATYVYTGLTAVRTFTLPDPTTVTAGKIFILKNATANTSSITAVGTVDGAVNPILISSAYGVRRLISNGIVWLSI
jgi:roadblock/LC7 domain-containing protein